MGPRAYVLWTYTPSMVVVLYGVIWMLVVLYGVIWMLVDSDIKRLEKYRQLSRASGCHGTASICLDYHCFWSPFSIFQALRYRQWAVVCSSTGYVLSLLVVPNLQSYVFYWATYSGGTLAWGGRYSWQTGQVDPYWSKVLLGVLSLNLLCAVSIILILALQPTGIVEDQIGIASVTALVLDANPSDFGLDSGDATNSWTDILIKLSAKHFSISEQRKLSMQDNRVTPQMANQPANGKLAKFLLQCQRISPVLVTRFLKKLQRLGQGITKRFNTWVLDSPHSFLFQPLPLFLWNAVLVLLLCATLHVLSAMASPSQLSAKNYALPWSPNAYLLVGVFVQVKPVPSYWWERILLTMLQSIFQVLERNVRCLTVFDALRHGYQSPRILWDDYTCSRPVLEIVYAFDRGQHLLGYVMLASLATVVYTILLGSLQVSASYYGSTTFSADLAGVATVFSMNMFILLVSLAVTWRYGRTTFLPRYPASLLPFVLFSEKLKEDLRAVNDQSSVKAKVQKLKEASRRYGFGKFHNGNPPTVEHFGIERNYIDGPNGKDHVNSYDLTSYGWTSARTAWRTMVPRKRRP